MVFLAFLKVLFTCLLTVDLGSELNHSVLGCYSVGRVMFPILSQRAMLISAGSGVKRVVVILETFSCRSFSFVH